METSAGSGKRNYRNRSAISNRCCRNVSNVISKGCNLPSTALKLNALFRCYHLPSTNKTSYSAYLLFSYISFVYCEMCHILTSNRPKCVFPYMHRLRSLANATVNVNYISDVQHRNDSTERIFSSHVGRKLTIAVETSTQQKNIRRYDDVRQDGFR